MYKRWNRQCGKECHDKRYLVVSVCSLQNMYCSVSLKALNIMAEISTVASCDSQLRCSPLCFYSEKEVLVWGIPYTYGLNLFFLFALQHKS